MRQLSLTLWLTSSLRRYPPSVPLSAVMEMLTGAPSNDDRVRLWSNLRKVHRSACGVFWCRGRTGIPMGYSRLGDVMVTPIFFTRPGLLMHACFMHRAKTRSNKDSGMEHASMFWSTKSASYLHYAWLFADSTRTPPKPRGT